MISLFHLVTLTRSVNEMLTTNLVFGWVFCEEKSNAHFENRDENSAEFVYVRCQHMQDTTTIAPTICTGTYSLSLSISL